MALPLAGRRILVPPSRLGPNPLINMLERQGAQVPVFPTLMAGDVDTAPMDEAIAELDTFGVLVMAGEASVHRLLERLQEAGRGPEALPPRRVAIGHGAVVALRRAGQEATVKPRDHFAAGVVDAMGPVRGEAILLVREAGASGALPKLLVERGARVVAIAGHATAVRATLEDARRALGSTPDAVAFANPATIRFFVQALAELGLLHEQCLGCVPLVAVGPATAGAAASLGLPADAVARGKLRRLQETLIELLGEAPRLSPAGDAEM